MPETEWDDILPGVSGLSNVQLDERLEDAAIANERSEKLICCLLSEVRERHAFREFGYGTIYDYAMERFGFKERKTRYLLLLGRKLKELPQLREALRRGKLGWCKAVRIAAVASRQDETMWLDSALSLSVAELDRRIKDGTDRLASLLHMWLSEDQRVIWENALEIARRVAGVELSPSQALEYMAAEFIATWGNGGAPPHDAEEDSELDETRNDGTSPEEPSDERELEVESVSGFADPVVEQEGGDELAGEPVRPESELDEAIDNGSDKQFRRLIYERDQWKCSYPGCNARRELHAHHIQFRSRGGRDEAWNCTTICSFHHDLLHAAQVSVKGRAPHELEWTPPKLMREVIERRRNRAAHWVGELEIREWPAHEPVTASP